MSQFTNPSQPYQTPKHTGRPSNGTNPLLIPAIILIALSAIMILYGLVNVVSVFFIELPDVPNEDPAVKTARMAGFYAAAFGIPIINFVVLLGGIAMLTKKFYPMAVIGAVTALVPLCGPCFVLGIPFGIWALILLFRADVKASFS